MAEPPGSRLRPRERLSRGADYRRVLRLGMRLDGPLFVLVAAENDRGYSRLGLSASRKVGHATERNRAKRLLRESFRRNRIERTPALDLVLIPKRGIATRTLGEVEHEYRQRVRRLASRRGHGPAAPASH